MKRVFILFVVAASCFAQEQVQQQRQVQGNASRRTDSTPKVTDEEAKARQAKARDLLQLAESEARGLEPSGRALSLSQIANAYTGVDRAKAVTLLQDAFTATTEMDPGPEKRGDKRMLQDRILDSLLGLEADSLPELLPRAESSSRSRARGRLISRAAQKKDFALAAELVNQAAADDAPFPYDGVVSFLMALPPDASAERLNAFMQAYTAYSRSPNSGGGFSNQGFDRVVVRFGALLPKDMTLKAIDEILSRAKSADNDARFTLSSSAGTATFNSSYDYYLFELLPVLRKFDSAKADDLLQQNTQLQGTMSKFPNGLTSLDPTIRDTPPKQGENSGMSFSVNSGGNRASGSNRGAPVNSGPSTQQIMGQYESEIMRIRDMASKDPQQALSQAMNLSEMVGSFPVRLGAIQGIAAASVEKNPSDAREALDRVLKAAANLPPDHRAAPLLDAAGLYLKLEDSDAAAKAIDSALKTAELLYETDSNADDPNKAIKGFWPSTALWAQCLSLAFKAEPARIPEILAGVKDDEIRTSLRIAYAMALTGNSPTMITTMVNRKGQNSMTMNESRAK